MIGREGATGLALVLGSDDTLYQTLCQIAGTALVLDAHRFRKAIATGTVTGFLPARPKPDSYQAKA